MIFNVGINAADGTAIADNGINVIKFDVEKLYTENIELVFLIFNDVKSNVNGELGCVSIHLSYDYGNEIRKQFVRAGLSCGFKKVGLMNYVECLYFCALLHSNYTLKAESTFWIFHGSYGYEFDTSSQSVTYDENLFFENLEAEAEKETFSKDEARDILIQKYNSKFDISRLKEVFTNAHFFDYQNTRYTTDGFEESALSKAKFMAGASDVFDFKGNISIKYVINIGDHEIMSIHDTEKLPVMRSVKVTADNDVNVATLKRKKYDNIITVETFQLPHFSTYFIRFKADKNSIYSVEFIDASNVDDDVEPKLKRPRYDNNDNNNVPGASCQTSYIFPKKITLNNEKIEAVGIDLGTTRCCVAVNRRSGIETVAIENESGRLMPSYVSFDGNNPKCGNVVIHRLRYHAESTVFDSKRIIGQNYSAIKINNHWPFELVNSQNKAVLKLKVDSIEVRKTAEEIAAALLKNLKQKAEEFQGKRLSKAVITIPATFTKSQEDATHLAGILAGWDIVVLLPEPIAAAFAYFIDRPISNNYTLLLFDLGGGTLDVCIFEIKDKEIQIISKSGHASLGGRDFDNLLMNFFEDKLKTEHQILLPKGKYYTLMFKCQEIKHDLSIVDNGRLDVDDFDVSKNGSININREMFDTLATDLLKQIQDSLMEALNNLNYQPTQITKILLVGGGCKMPMIKKLLKRYSQMQNNAVKSIRMKLSRLELHIMLTKSLNRY